MDISSWTTNVFAHLWTWLAFSCVRVRGSKYLNFLKLIFFCFWQKFGILIIFFIFLKNQNIPLSVSFSHPFFFNYLCTPLFGHLCTFLLQQQWWISMRMGQQHFSYGFFFVKSFNPLYFVLSLLKNHKIGSIHFLCIYVFFFYKK